MFSRENCFIISTYHINATFYNTPCKYVVPKGNVPNRFSFISAFFSCLSTLVHAISCVYLNVRKEQDNFMCPLATWKNVRKFWLKVDLIMATGMAILDVEF